MSRARDLADSADKDIAGTLTLDGLSVSGDVAVDTDTLFVDASADSVGIGTSSPARQLEIYDDGTNGQAVLALTAQNTQNSRIMFADTDDNNIGILDYNHSDDSMRFVANNSERMRIDNGGNLLVGKTTTGTNIVGIQAQGSGFAGITRDGGTTLVCNRKTSDGEIVQFQKDGSTVGRIGTEGNDLAIGNDDAGIQFVNGNEHFRPFNMSTNAATDALMDIGSSSKRFKDLYLSGGVYLGGTGSANYLDDYETGTFTPTLDLGTNITYNAHSGRYTKIGNLVHCEIYIDVATMSNDTSGIHITLPFNSNSSDQQQVSGSIGSHSSLLGSKGDKAIGMACVNSSAFLYEVGQDLNYIGYSEVYQNAPAKLSLSITYRVE
jgi:hypothetical protein